MLQAPIVCLAQTGDAAAAVGEKWPGPVAVEKQTTGQEQTGESCAQCHQKESRDFAASVHSKSQTCADCHQPHATANGGDKLPAINRQEITSTCGACHSGEVLTSYKESFHGRALSLGSSTSASCTDCHGGHLILKSTDSESTVAAANVPTMCGECHTDAKVNYAAGIEHKLLASEGDGAPQYWTFKFFIWLTIITVICLILHMELELFHLFRKARGKA